MRWHCSLPATMIELCLKFYRIDMRTRLHNSASLLRAHVYYCAIVHTHNWQSKISTHTPNRVASCCRRLKELDDLEEGRVIDAFFRGNRLSATVTAIDASRYVPAQ
jgi:hypothetical protein